MSKLQQLLDKQKELASQIEKAREDEKIQQEKSFIALYKKLRLDRFTTEQIEEALNLIIDSATKNQEKSVAKAPKSELKVQKAE